MPDVEAVCRQTDVVVEIGGLPIRFRSSDPTFLDLIQQRYAGYVNPAGDARFEFDVELAPPGTESGDEEVQVTWEAGRWLMQRGDFRAEWDPSTSRGRIQQTINP
jgi:hypothetical protein